MTAAPPDLVGAVDVRSGLVRAGAGASLERIERAVRAADWSLGPLSPRMESLLLGEFLEGPWAGLRPIRGGRLEPIAAALAVALPSGHTVESRAAPRSAAGPDLDALFLGGEGRYGRILEATLRLSPLPRAERTAGFGFPAAAAAVDALLGALGAGVWLRSALVQPRGEGFVFVASVIGTPDSVERDAATLEAFARRSGGRGAAHERMPSAVRSAEERELDWADVERALGAGRSLELFRLSLESAVAAGAGELGASLRPDGGWADAAEWRSIDRALEVPR